MKNSKHLLNLTIILILALISGTSTAQNTNVIYSDANVRIIQEQNE